MKRILCLLLIIVMLLLSFGCNSQEQPSESETESNQSTEAKQTEPKVYDNTPYSKNEVLILQDGGYNRIEYLLDNVSDIVKATYVGTIKKHPNYLHDFEVKEVVKGNCEKTIVTILATPQTISTGWAYTPVKSYSSVEIEYETGKDYLLLLRRQQSIYKDEEILSPIEDTLILPLNESGSLDLEKCKMYNTDLMLHLKDTETEQALKNGTFIERLLELTKNNPTVYNAIDKTDKEPIVTMNEADCVWIVKVERKIEDLFLPYYVSKYYCKVTKTLKGEEKEELRIQLPTEEVEIGKSYIIATQKKWNSYYLSSHNSLFEYSE